jgi:hypothetical protein
MAKETHPTPEQIAEKEKRKEIDALRSSLPQKPFEAMTRAEKDELLFVLVKEKGLI